MKNPLDTTPAYKLLDDFFAAGRMLQFARREIILPTSKKPDGFYWIRSGTVKVFSNDDGNHEVVHHLYKEHELFPIMWLFNDLQYDVGFSAFTDTVVHRRPILETQQFLNDNPAALIALLHQQSQLNDRILTLNLLSAEQRVIRRIFALADRFGQEHGDHVTVRLPQTVQDFAESVRLSRESTGKILGQLEQDGAIVMSRRQLIMYPAKLRELFGSPNGYPE